MTSPRQRRLHYKLRSRHRGAERPARQDHRAKHLGLLRTGDDFKVRSNLTLNLGLRWSYFGPLSAKEGNMFVAHPWRRGRLPIRA
jgi:hypothetical protein